MRLRRSIWLLSVPALLILAGLLAWWWLLHTESGARWTFERAATATAASVGATRVSGDLSSGLQLEGLEIDDGHIRVEAETLAISVRIALLPIAVEVSTLHARNLRLRVSPDSSGESGPEKTPGRYVSPFPLAFRDIRISGIEYSDFTGEDPVVIDLVEAAGSVDESLVLDRLSVSFPEDRLEVSGRLALVLPFASELKFRSGGRFEVEGSLIGDTDSAELVLNDTSHGIQVKGNVSQLLSKPSWELEANSSSLQWPLDNPAPTITLTGAKLRTTGEWPVFQVDLEAGLETKDLDPLRLELSGTGSTRDFTAQILSLQGPGVSLGASGTLSWENTLRLGLVATVDQLDPLIWLPDWPENHPLNGNLEIEWEAQSLSISDFNLAIANTATTAQGHATVAMETGIVDVSLGWNNANWPLDNASPAVASRSGELRVAGQPEDWQLNGALDLRFGEFPPGRLQLNGSGDDESMRVTVQEAQVLEGKVSGDFSWNWTGQQVYEARLSARQVTTTALFPDYPGVLNTRLTLKGEVEPFHLGVEIEELDGMIRGYPVSGRGGIHIERDRVFASDLQLGSGASTLLLDGSLYEPGGMDFSATIDSLARFAEGYRGSFSAEGNLSLNPASPRMSVLLSGQDLLLGPVAIGRMESRKLSAPGEEPGSEISLSGLVIGHRPVESMSLFLGGSQPFGRIAFEAESDGTEVSMELQGSITDWNDPAGSGWRGELSGLRINHQDQIVLTLEQAAAVEWTPSNFQLEPVCLGSTGDARLCMASTWRDPDDLSISAKIVALPVSLLKIVSDTELKFSQVLNGTLEWSQSAANGRNGTARFEISPGAIRMADDDEILLETGTGLFGFELAGGTLQNGDLDLDFPGMGEIDIDFNVPDLNLGSESPISGNASVDFRDLSAFGPVFPLLDTISGALEVELAVAGTLSDPAFSGDASLTNGQFANLASGFSFSEINISGDVSDRDRSNLHGTFRAGEGTGNVSATVAFDNLTSPVIELLLKGESLTIIDVPDLNVVANPDLTLTWRDNALEVNGRVFIPKARLSPSYLPQQSIRQSEDVVIVAGELPEPETDFLKENPLRIRGVLEVELGKQAQIDLDMAKVRVYGTTRFNWDGELLPIATGNFDIRGDIQAYGQSLKVTQGRISFPGIPANNPHLNIRAERSIYGNSQIQKAGLMVAGTVKRPIIEAYTVPMTNKDRAQTLLVTGSDFNYEQGVGAVAVGAYVLPRLYISYGIGVFEEGNVISARYDLGKRFGVKVTSGQKDTGVDLNYTIER